MHSVLLSVYTECCERNNSNTLIIKLFSFKKKEKRVLVCACLVSKGLPAKDYKIKCGRFLCGRWDVGVNISACASVFLYACTVGVESFLPAFSMTVLPPPRFDCAVNSCGVVQITHCGSEWVVLSGCLRGMHRRDIARGKETYRSYEKRETYFHVAICVGYTKCVCACVCIMVHSACFISHKWSYY